MGDADAGCLTSRLRSRHFQLWPSVGDRSVGLHPGTLPVHLIAGLGTAVAIAVRNQQQRTTYCLDRQQRGSA